MLTNLLKANHWYLAEWQRWNSDFYGSESVLFEDTMLGRKLCLNQGENCSALDWNSEGSPRKLQGQPIPILGWLSCSNVFKCVTLRQRSLGLETVPTPRIQVQF